MMFHLLDDSTAPAAGVTSHPCHPSEGPQSKRSNIGGVTSPQGPKGDENVNEMFTDDSESEPNPQTFW